MALSKTQSTRLGVILSVMAEEDVPDDFIQKVLIDGFVSMDRDGRPALTDLGIDEKNRLCTLAGLNIKYLSERKKEDERSREGYGDCADVSQDPISAGV